MPAFLAVEELGLRRNVVARLMSSRLFKAGLVLLVLGTGPLTVIILAAELGLTSDPNPNPIGPGLLAFVTFWPSVIMIAAGAVRAVRAANDSDPRVGPGRPGEATRAYSVRSVVQGPLGRGLAAIGGAMLLIQGVASLDTESRGAAGAMVVGAACLSFAVAGQWPEWLRLRRRR
jgi:hypothetical protein